MRRKVFISAVAILLIGSVGAVVANQTQYANRGYLDQAAQKRSPDCKYPPCD